MIDYLLATPNWSELEIDEYTPKLVGCLSDPADGSDGEIINKSRKCTTRKIPDKGLASHHLSQCEMTEHTHRKLKDSKVLSKRRPMHW